MTNLGSNTHYQNYYKPAPALSQGKVTDYMSNIRKIIGQADSFERSNEASNMNGLDQFGMSANQSE